MLDDPRRVKSDMAIMRRAIREGWKIPAQVLSVAPMQMAKILASGSERDQISAAKTLLEMHKQNVIFDQTPEPVEKEKPLSNMEVTEDNIELVKSLAAQRLARLSANS